MSFLQKGLSKRRHETMKKIIPIVYLKDNNVFCDNECFTKIDETLSPVDVCLNLEASGADELFIMEMSYDDASHDSNISMLRQIAKEVEIPINVGGNIKRVEDVKKYLYSGCRRAVLDSLKETNTSMMTEVCNRFGKEKIGILIKENSLDSEIADLASENGVNSYFTQETDCFALNGDNYIVKADIKADFFEKKNELKSKGFEICSFESSMSFDEFKTNSDGLIPVIVQDYKTDEVLMLAYMNKEAYYNTIKTGKMTYYSRSRNSQWIKGETSGHYQYVKSLDIDCDNDTILAKVKQVGAACHTGNYSCFYRNLAKKDFKQTNPLKVFSDVMGVIEDRKLHPKEGSYTNYLFDKGIDKILKKVGEEATEIIIAAKNPDSEEIIYEISDFLYHVMVLMSLKEVTWEEIIAELANR